MRYKATVYAVYVSELESPTEAGARLEAENQMVCEMTEFFHPKVKIMVKLEAKE